MSASIEHASAHQAEDTISRISSSLSEVNSRHSSVQGPYREGIPDDGFPICSVVASPSPKSHLYARSLLSSGNGFGLYVPNGGQGRPQGHLDGKVALLGDVGQIDPNGFFDFSFNIFFDANHPIQWEELPQNFRPISPSLGADESVHTPNFLTPGTVLASDGIKVSRLSTAPLNVGFETRAREGAVLVLPTGANREELVDPSRIYSYVKDNAVSWYQYLNGHNGEEISVGTSNGALYVVIGIDRADSWATAVFPPVNADGIFKRKDLKFKYMEGKARTPWEDDGKHVVQYQSKSPPKASPGAVFLRLMAIALSPVEWTRYIAYTRPEAIPRYPILSAPKSELQERLQRFLSRFMDVSNDKYHVRKCLFHPSLPLLHALLLTYPSAKIGIITDSMWSSHLSKRSLIYPEIINLMCNVLMSSVVTNTAGVLTLVSRAEVSAGAEQAPSKQRVALARLLGRIVPWVFEAPKEADTPAIIRNMYKVLDPNLL